MSTETQRAEFEAWVRDHLLYDPQTGVLSWKKKPNPNIPIGRYIGHPNRRGHLRLCSGGRTWMVHRVAWFLHYGKWPDGQIDHKNGIPSDNRIDNLRDVTQEINMQNQRKPHKNNISGFLGVSQSGRASKPWKASIKTNGVNKNLGYFLTPEEAHIAYLKAKKVLHPGMI